MRKDEIIDILNEIARLLELKGENPFKVRAYQNGSRALEACEEELGDMIKNGELGKMQGIGKALVEKIETLYTSGKLPYYDELKASVPKGMLDMLNISGLGPKKIKKMHDALGIESIAALKQACSEGQVAELPGFGKKIQENLLSGIEHLEVYAKRHLWWKANEVAQPILNGLRALDSVQQADIAGSLRRRRETVGDLDFIVAADDAMPIMDWFTRLEDIIEVTAKGATKSSIRLNSGLQADLRVVPSEQFYYALHHFTGSKDHNVRMRQRALAQGLSLSEWGLAPKDEEGKMDATQSIYVDSEKALFARLGLDAIPPELREDHGEVEAAEEHRLPVLIKLEDIRGVLHNHTSASDGKNTLEEMAQAAQHLGFEFLGIADHSKSSVQANGLTPERLIQQVEEIHKLNQSQRFTTHLFAGSEVDILKNGSLDFEDEILQQLDYVVVSVHSAFTLDRNSMTKRIIKALENEHVTLLAHLTGRLLLRREGYELDIPKIIDAAIANGKMIELNANPKRLDMDWRYWHKAAERGLMCIINPDAHSTDQLAYVRAGVNAARKGWLTKEQVINCLPLEAFKKQL